MLSDPENAAALAPQTAAQVSDLDLPDLRTRLAEAEETIRAIRSGEVDAVMVDGRLGPQVYTLEGADHPYRVLVEQMHDGTVTLGEDGLILYSNPQMITILGATANSVTGTSFKRFLHATSMNAFAALIEAAATRGHSAGDVNLRDELGNVIPVRLALTPLPISDVGSISILVSDLREQRRNEMIVKEEQLSRLILDQAGEGIVVIDTHGIVIRRSESAKLMSDRLVLLESFDDVFPLSSAGVPFTSAHILAAARAEEPVRGIDTVMRHSDGRTSALSVSASPLWGESGELLGCVVILTDITAHKLAEQALARQAEELARSNSDLRQFAYSASHDLREPLRQLAVLSELVQQRYADKIGSEGERLIRHAVNAAHRMEKLVSDLLAYIQAADAPQDDVAPVDATEVVRKLLATFETQMAETMARIEWEPLPLLAVHEVHLVQLLQNLIGNALKYHSDAPPHIRIQARQSQSMWELSVADNGIGISPDYQAQVFELFKRLHGGGKYSGSGIGLAICQKIVHRYGGRIWIESQAGRGATFRFTLPSA
jgi:PAS domain S-box-containing protein